LEGSEGIVNFIIGDRGELLAQEGEGGRGQVDVDWLGIGGGCGGSCAHAMRKEAGDMEVLYCKIFGFGFC